MLGEVSEALGRAVHERKLPPDEANRIANSFARRLDAYTYLNSD